MKKAIKVTIALSADSDYKGLLMDNKHILLKGTLILTLAGFLTKILGFLYRIFLSQTIGAQGMGIYQLIFPIHTLCFALTVGGIQTAISRFVAARVALKDEQGARDIFLIATSLSMAISFAVTFLLYRHASWFAVHILLEEQCTDLLRVSSLSIPMGTFHSCAYGYYLARKKTGIPAWSQLVEQTARMSATYLLYLVWTGEGHPLTPMLAVVGLFAGELVSMLFSLLFILWDYRKYHYQISNIHAPGKDLKDIVSLSLPLTGNRLFINILHSMESVLIPGHLQLFGMDSASALSIYGVLNGMALPLILFPSAITNAVSAMLLPSVAQDQAVGNYKNIRRSIFTTTRYCLLLGFLSTAFFYFSGDFLGLFLFKNEFAGTFIKTLSFICPCLYLSSTLSGILNGLGETGKYFAQNLLGLSIRLLFVFFVIPRFGILGYLWGLLISELAITLLTLFFLKDYMKTAPGE